MTAMNGWLRDKMRALLSGLNRDDSVGTEPLDDDGVPESVRRGLEQSAAGEVVDLGDFTQYASEQDEAAKRGAWS